jgi:hypothetical protein
MQNTYMFMYLEHMSNIWYVYICIYIIQKQKKTIGDSKSLTTNFLSWICQPFSKRIQRSVPSGFSYSQKPNAKKKQINRLDGYRWNQISVPWSLPLAPCTRFQLTTLPQF